MYDRDVTQYCWTESLLGFLAFSSESDAYDRSRTNCQYNSLIFEGDVRPIGSNSVILKEDEIIFFFK